MSPPNMLLRHKDYFKLKVIENEQLQEEFLPSPDLTTGHKFFFVKVSPSPVSRREQQLSSPQSALK